MKIIVVILTYNEEIHLARCIASVKEIADDIVVADCFSTDATLEIARNHGARIIQREWTNHATQFNWALTQLDEGTEWVLRIDADEYLTPELIYQIQALQHVTAETEGVVFGRRMTFQGKLIRFGGVFPVKVLRLFRYGRGHCENRWMDEHIVVSGKTIELNGELIDDNLNSLTWWTEKHNKYATLEALEMLNLEFNFMRHNSPSGLTGCKQSLIKRWLKEAVYSRLPGGIRAFVYFLYRFVIRLGFLDGRAGAAFHFLQGFWYRYLVDMKIAEVKRYMLNNKVDVRIAIVTILGISFERLFI
jgi:glycosyltransferase involved in cell wall biosynthesis